LLINTLRDNGVVVERPTELIDFEEKADHIVAELKHADGHVESCAATFVAGGGGARSRGRETLSVGFPGGPDQHPFYVAGVEAHGAVMDGEIHAALDSTDFLVVFPLKDARRARLIGTMREDVASRRGDLSWKDVATRVLEWIRIEVDTVNWFSTYHVHHRVAN